MPRIPCPAPKPESASALSPSHIGILGCTASTGPIRGLKSHKNESGTESVCRETVINMPVQGMHQSSNCSAMGMFLSYHASFPYSGSQRLTFKFKQPGMTSGYCIEQPSSRASSRAFKMVLQVNFRFPTLIHHMISLTQALISIMGQSSLSFCISDGTCVS